MVYSLTGSGTGITAPCLGLSSLGESSNYDDDGFPQTDQAGGSYSSSNNGGFLGVFSDVSVSISQPPANEHAAYLQYTGKSTPTTNSNTSLATQCNQAIVSDPTLMVDLMKYRENSSGLSQDDFNNAYDFMHKYAELYQPGDDPFANESKSDAWAIYTGQKSMPADPKTVLSQQYNAELAQNPELNKDLMLYSIQGSNLTQDQFNQAYDFVHKYAALYSPGQDPYSNISKTDAWQIYTKQKDFPADPKTEEYSEYNNELASDPDLMKLNMLYQLQGTLTEAQFDKVYEFRQKFAAILPSTTAND